MKRFAWLLILLLVPVNALAFIGSDQVYTSDYSMNATYGYTRLYTAPETGSLDIGYVYKKNTDQAELKLCLYEDTGDGPRYGRLLGYVEINGGTTTGWKNAQFTGGSVTQGNKYWLTIYRGSTNTWITTLQDNENIQAAWRPNVGEYYTTPPDPMTAGWTNSSGSDMSMYITITPVTITEYHVATDGNDGNIGSAEFPWQTIQHAMDTVSPGDTVIVHEGTYVQTLNMLSGGTETDPIIFRADGVVTIEKTEVDMTVKLGTSDSPADYVTFDGFIIDGKTYAAGNGIIIQNCSMDSSGRTASTLGIYGVSDGVKILNNRFTTNDGAVVLSTGKDTTNALIEGNLFDHIYNTDATRLFGAYHIFRNNEVVGMDEGGIHADLFQVYDYGGEVSHDILVEKNYFHDSSGACGMMQNRTVTLNISNWTFRNNLYLNLGQVFQGSMPGMKFYNNTFIYTGDNTSGPILLRSQVESDQWIPGNYAWPRDCEIKNNIFIGCGSYPDGSNGWYHWADGLSPSTPDINFSADNNYVTTTRDNGYLPKSGFSEPNGINGGDPLFVDEQNNDVHLTANSPAVNTGVAIASFSDDYDGITRPQGAAWDIGAYEYNGSEDLPPVISVHGPIGEQNCSINPTTITLDVSTNETAECKYSTTDQSFDIMENTFQNTNALSHTSDIPLACDASYQYYVRCKDTAGNANPTSAVISFSVKPELPLESKQLFTYDGSLVKYNNILIGEPR